MDIPSYLLGKKAGGGGGGTSDYTQLSNKPSINGVTLNGNKTSDELGIVDDILVLILDDTSDAAKAKVGKAITDHYGNGLIACLSKAKNPAFLYNVLNSKSTTYSFTYSAPTIYDKINNNQDYYYFTVTGSWDGDVFTCSAINYYQSGGFDPSRKVLGVKNTNEYTPTGDYNPATKKYVDDTILVASGVVITDDNYNSAEIISAVNSAYQNFVNNKPYFLFAKVSARYNMGGVVQLYFAGGLSSADNPTWYLYSPTIINSVNDGTGRVGFFISVGLTISSNEVTAITQPNRIKDTYAPQNTTGYYLKTGNTSSYNVSNDYNPAHKKYVDDKPTTYSGYDATKTQILKNVNGTLTWVDEV